MKWFTIFAIMLVVAASAAAYRTSFMYYKDPSERKVSNAYTTCTTLYDPICGSDGKTYTNSCFATQKGVAVESKGPCTERVSKRTTSETNTCWFKDAKTSPMTCTSTKGTCVSKIQCQSTRKCETSTCNVKVSGYMGEKITWTSNSCGSQESTIKGRNQYVIFNCGRQPVNQLTRATTENRE